MRASLRLSIACSLFVLAGCRSRPTQVTLLLDSNVSATRAQTLTITALRGEHGLAELSTASIVTRLTNASSSLFPGSVAVVPRAGQPRSDLATVLAVLDVPAQQSQPALRIERLQRVRLIEHVPQQGRIFFNAECGAPSTGCTSVAASECTVGRRCIDQGLTCGDEGLCVPLELPVIVVPPETPLDATIIDARSPSSDAANARDASASDASAPDGAADSGVRLAAHLYEPMPTSTVSSRRPLLRWDPPMRGVTSTVRLCRNRGMFDACLPAMNTTLDQLPIPADLDPGVWFWRVSSSLGGVALEDSPVWQFRVPARSALAAPASFGVEPDFNGDGYADVVVGVPGGPSSVWVVSGSASGFANQTPLEITSRLSRFGSSVASAGDLNGDGFVELVVGAPDAGIIRVYWGAPTGLDPLRFTELRSSPQSMFGCSVSAGGDLDGDGYGELLVGAYLASPGGRAAAGTVSIYFGAPDGLSETRAQVLEGALAGDWFGFSVAGAMNVTGSTTKNIVVGAYGADVGAWTNVGSVTVFAAGARGVNTVPVNVYVGSSPDAEYGWSVANAGDVNGDGRSDLIVGSPWVDVGARQDSGQVHVFLSNANGLPAAPTHEFNGGDNNEYLGWSVASAGDTNNDGFDDVLLGAKGFATIAALGAEGRVSVYLGSSAGLGGAPVSVYQGRSRGALLGSSVSSACDVNGDGFSEIILGARGEAIGGQMDAGSASVYAGGVNGPVSNPLRVFVGTAASDWVGGSVASRLIAPGRSSACSAGLTRERHVSATQCAQLPCCRVRAH
ncbi:MAG: FG-GAP-like repeat-containing protein [Polyangiales bacterium]